MRLKAGCELVMTAATSVPLVAMLRPRSGEAQWIVRERYDLDPFVRVLEYTDSFGNLCQRLVAPAGSFRIRAEAVVEVSEAIATAPGAAPAAPDLLSDNVLQFLLPSRYCPSDTLEAFAREVVSGKTPGYDQADAIRAWIHDNVAYRYGVSNASTSATDTLRDRAGVCRDYSHVGISLCRALRIPARMVVGFLHGLNPMDMHAWYEAFVGARWYTFDATQTKPRGGRIAVAYGRDAADVAFLTEFGPLKLESTKSWVKRLAPRV
jgi:transglutaminase-like putative cysteine protease